MRTTVRSQIVGAVHETIVLVQRSILYCICIIYHCKVACPLAILTATLQLATAVLLF